MGNVKISALTAATTLIGTEVLPIVQSATTKKATVNDLHAAYYCTPAQLAALTSSQIAAIGSRKIVVAEPVQSLDVAAINTAVYQAPDWNYEETLSGVSSGNKVLVTIEMLENDFGGTLTVDGVSKSIDGLTGSFVFDVTAGELEIVNNFNSAEFFVFTSVTVQKLINEKASSFTTDVINGNEINPNVVAKIAVNDEGDFCGLQGRYSNGSLYAEGNINGYYQTIGDDTTPPTFEFYRNDYSEIGLAVTGITTPDSGGISFADITFNKKFMKVPSSFPQPPITPVGDSVPYLSGADLTFCQAILVGEAKSSFYTLDTAGNPIVRGFYGIVNIKTIY